MAPSDGPNGENSERIATLAAFWPYYLNEHRSARNRQLHFGGTTLALALVIGAIFLRRPQLALAAPLAGYGFAWLGHFIVERNRPATFRYPIWSLLCDLRLWWQMLQGRRWR